MKRQLRLLLPLFFGEMIIWACPKSSKELLYCFSQCSTKALLFLLRNAMKRAPSFAPAVACLVAPAVARNKRGKAAPRQVPPRAVLGSLPRLGPRRAPFF